jgi:hypothetical protein
MWLLNTRIFPPLRWLAQCIVSVVRVVVCVQFIVLVVYLTQLVISLLCIALCTLDHFIQRNHGQNSIVDVLTRAYGRT